MDQDQAVGSRRGDDVVPAGTPDGGAEGRRARLVRLTELDGASFHGGGEASPSRLGGVRFGNREMDGFCVAGIFFGDRDGFCFLGSRRCEKKWRGLVCAGKAVSAGGTRL
jgi:hypothetical protein